MGRGAEGDWAGDGQDGRQQQGLPWMGSINFQQRRKSMEFLKKSNTYAKGCDIDGLKGVLNSHHNSRAWSKIVPINMNL